MPAPTLGYGERGEAPINAVNQYMRAAPWYQALIKSFGQDPANVHLTDNQKQQVIRAAQANGIVVDEGHNGQEVDDSGNFKAKSHALRNTLIVGGLAAATLLTAGGAGAAWGIGPAWGGTAAAGGGVGGALGGDLALETAAGIAGGGVGPGALAAGTAAAGGGSGLMKALAPSLVGTLGSVFTNVYGTNKQIEASDKAADLQAKAAADQLAFAKAQSDRDLAMAEATRHGNYDIFAARERRLGTLGGLIGAGPREVPDYVPIAGGGTPAAAGAGAPPAGGIDPKVSAFIADWQQKNPASQGIAPLADAIAKQFPGVTRYDVNGTPSNNELNIGGTKYKVLAGENTPAASWYVPGTNDSAPGAAAARRYNPMTLGAYVPYTTAPPLTPALTTRYAPGSLGYFG